ncbi:AMP-binding protein [Cupriavidus numazuensis]|uniref:Crotonobetaine/carnitine--CoA ligase n=1 Tax=Cupriavidus numazuensis TaxID=221992 RepID=A0ABN7QGF5_9BURK|nr:AMP-binding protein [Cupriavidus numazuensis]CAG2160748.1 Crotonobetaine/carnitine--CoA ligase [Cupriavidus numazuensis]
MLQLPVVERTLGLVLREQAKKYPKKKLLVFEGQSFSYKEAEALTASLATGFRRAGICKGDRVAIQMANCPEMVWVLFALGWIGAIAIPINTAAKADLLKYYIEQSRASCVVVDRNLALVMQEATASLDLRNFIIHDESIEDSAITIDVGGGHSATSLDSLFDPPESSDSGDEPKFSDLQLIMYTSGTTGRSKGVMCTHAQELTGGLFMAEQMGYNEDDVLYTCLPLFHVNALRVTIYAALWAGATVAMSRRFSASRFWAEIRAYGATQFNALGAIANIILRQPPSDMDRNHKVRLCNIVPALPATVATEFEQRFNVAVTSMYGSTEFCCPVFAPPGTPREKGATCGRVVEPFEMRVVDENDFEVPVGQVGEWVIRAREPWFVFQGYFEMERETQAVWRNGWFHSGDRGYRDEEGFFYFVDRAKDCVRRRGENISSFEVEMLINEHPAVLEVAVVPMASELSEDEVLAFVVLREGMICEYRELIEFCRERMADFMVPRYLRILDQLPKTPSEKIEKYKLRQIAENDPNRLWDRAREDM